MAYNYGSAMPQGPYNYGGSQGYGEQQLAAYGPSDQWVVRGAPDAGFGVKTVFLQGRRKRLNIVAMLLGLFLPWIVFSIVYAVMSFSLHYQQPWLCYSIVAAAFFIVIATFCFASTSLKKRRAGDMAREPSWYIFLAITTFLGWAAGVVAGDTNFFTNMQPFFDILNLNTYPGVNPSLMKGQQLMDAGRIMFAEGTQLDIGRSMGFRNMDLYCVAPITTAASVSTNGPNATRLETYDFWAVGTNCCSGSAADFHCGEFNNPRARAGLRLMRDDQRAFYRLAVQQAEAAYNIKATHPLFFTWMQDPNQEVGAYQDDGMKYYLLGMFTYFSFQLFAVICASLAFSKMGDL